jgi:hypothetical protein
VGSRLSMIKHRRAVVSVAEEYASRRKTRKSCLYVTRSRAGLGLAWTAHHAIPARFRSARISRKAILIQIAGLNTWGKELLSTNRFCSAHLSLRLRGALLYRFNCG